MSTTLLDRLSAAAFALGLLSGPVFAAGAADVPPRNDWTFAGMVGHYDQTQLQRGFKVYREVCSACHSMSKVPFRTLESPSGPNFSAAQVEALAAQYQVRAGPNDQGEYFERPGRPADRIPPPFPNRQAAEAANGGAYPPDFSVIAKARTFERGFPWFVFDALPFLSYTEQGPDYIAALLQGYEENPPAGVEVPPGKYFNRYFPGHIISMPNVLSDGLVEYPKGPDGRPQVPETAAQYSKDVTAFLMWAAEPHLEQRKRMGFQVMAFLLLLGGLLYFTKKRIWSRIEGHA
jgi:ubiquinol-cytochrome c reductase cytochrome c1 subunit